MDYTITNLLTGAVVFTISGVYAWAIRPKMPRKSPAQTYKAHCGCPVEITSAGRAFAWHRKTCSLKANHGLDYTIIVPPQDGATIPRPAEDRT